MEENISGTSELEFDDTWGDTEPSTVGLKYMKKTLKRWASIRVYEEYDHTTLSM